MTSISCRACSIWGSSGESPPRSTPWSTPLTAPPPSPNLWPHHSLHLLTQAGPHIVTALGSIPDTRLPSVIMIEPAMHAVCSHACQLAMAQHCWSPHTGGIQLQAKPGVEAASLGIPQEQIGNGFVHSPLCTHFERIYKNVPCRPGGGVLIALRRVAQVSRRLQRGPCWASGRRVC